jgi:hypothetical protein
MNEDLLIGSFATKDEKFDVALASFTAVDAQ